MVALMRVYETRAERRRYAVFGLWSTLAVAAVFVASLSRPALAAAAAGAPFELSRPSPER
jgi:hypothetical protein